jgi:hypothetical protein
MNNFYDEFKDEPQDTLDDFFVWACLHGEFQKIKYLLISPDLSMHANIHTESDNGLTLALKKNHLNIVKYLLTSPELNEHSNIYQNQSTPFKAACMYSNNDILEYLILDYRMEKNQDITDYLNRYHHPFVNELFEKQALIKDLENNLSIGTNKTKSPKI